MTTTTRNLTVSENTKRARKIGRIGRKVAELDRRLRRNAARLARAIRNQPAFKD